MKIERCTTGLIIHDPSMVIKRKCLQYYSLSSPRREFFVYHKIDEEHDIIYVPSSFEHLDDKILQRELKLVNIKDIKPSAGRGIDLKMSREPRSELQRDCINKLTTSKSNKITVELKPGTGKAEPYSRKIPTPDKECGWINMGDIKIGDHVFDNHGNPTSVIGIFEQGDQDVFCVTFDDGRKAYCTKEHLWSFHTHKHPGWMTYLTSDLIKMIKRNRCYIPITEPVNYHHRDIPIDPWVVGCFIGNGCLTSDQLQLYSINDIIPEKIADMYGFTVKKLANVSSYIFYSNGEPVKTERFFRVIPSMVNTSASDKVIPDEYMYNDIENRFKLIQGLLDINGNIISDRDDFLIKFSAVSKVLLTQIRNILYSFGYSGTINDTVDEVCNYCGSLQFKLPNTAKHMFFTLLSKQITIASLSEEYKNSTRYYNDLRIVDISYSHVERCRCIMVSNPEHLYLTEDYIVTHNTFMSLYSICKLGCKPLIIAPTSLLKNQWLDNLLDSGLTEDDIALRIEDAPKKKACVITISSIENSIRDDFQSLINIVEQSQFGLKIVDEAHLHLKGILKFDAICNIRYNWYLSATLGRSDPDEDRVLNRALKDADRFIGSAQYEEYQHQYVNIVLQDIYYHASADICTKYFKYGKKGLIRSTYYNMLMNYNEGDAFMNNILDVTKKIKKMVPYGKTLILLPLIESIHSAIEYMKNDSYFNGKSVAGIDGKMSLSERKKAFEKDIILATSMSCGVGVDISDLSIVINFDQYSSPIITEQIFGRLRTRKDDKETYYVDICDHVKYAKSIENWGRKRRVILPYFPGACTEIKRFPNLYS